MFCLRADRSADAALKLTRSVRRPPMRSRARAHVDTHVLHVGSFQKVSHEPVPSLARDTRRSSASPSHARAAQRPRVRAVRVRFRPPARLLYCTVLYCTALTSGAVAAALLKYRYPKGRWASRAADTGTDVRAPPRGQAAAKANPDEPHPPQVFVRLEPIEQVHRLVRP